MLASHNLRLTPSLAVRDAGHILDQQIIHLLIANLEYLRSIGQTDWLNKVRHITHIPIIILSDNPEQDTRPMVQLGADICVSVKDSYPMIADLVYAQLRRYTQYNNNYTPGDTGNAAFQVGDIFLDPASRVVEVCGHPVNLRPREFSLLLYFMKHPNIVLTADQICKYAWGIEYTQPVGQSIYDLRQQIEANPNKPCYIKTIHRVGYRFTAYTGENCDDYESFRIISGK